MAHPGFDAERGAILIRPCAPPSRRRRRATRSGAFRPEGGDVEVALGNLPAALASHKAYLRILEDLAKTNPDNSSWQRDLSVGCNKVGEIEADQGDLSDALISYQSDLAIMQGLTKSNPGNVEWRRDLSISYDRIGDVQQDQTNWVGAQASFGEALAIRDQLSKAAPDNAGRQRDLSVSYIKVGFTQAMQGNLGAAPAAANDASAASKLAPGNPFVGIWLHIARAEAKQSDADEFAANARQIDQSRWPWPVVALFLGTMNPEEVRSAAAKADTESARAGLACEADFYVGAYQIGRDAITDAKPLLQSAADHCPRNFVEHPAAELQLRALDSGGAASASH